MDKELALLISSGSAICGAAAVLTVESSIKSAPHKSIIALVCVMLFGLVGMFAYPLVHSLSDLGLSESQWDILARVCMKWQM